MKNKNLKHLAVLAMAGCMSVTLNAEEADGQIGLYQQTMDSVTKPTPLDGVTGDQKGFDSGLYYIFFSASGASANGSALDYDYGGGCMVQQSNIANGDLDINLQLPDGHSIRGYRYFWNDTSASSSNAILFQFDGSGGLTTLDNIASTGDTGVGSFYQNLPDGDHVVNNTNGAYVMRFNSNENGSTQEMCGVRIAMVAP